MKTVLSILLLFLVFLTETSAQNYLPYYEKINEADLNHLNQDYERADSNFEMAFQLVDKPFKEDYLSAALNSQQLNDHQKTYAYLMAGVAQGLTMKRIKKQMKSFKASAEWKKLKGNYDATRTEHLSKLDVVLRQEISEMIRKDQKARAVIGGNWKKMRRVDHYNHSRLLEIIKENNGQWPGFSVIGEVTPKGKYDVSENIALMLLHFGRENNQKLLPIMLEAVLAGEMYPYHYARIVDYTIAIKVTNAENNRNIEVCFLYGIYGKSTICDCETAELERKKIGLPSIENYYRRMQSTYECLKE